MRSHALHLSRRLLALGIVLCSTSFATAEIADFDDLTLAAESHWNGPDPGGNDVVVENSWGGTSTVRLGGFHSGGVAFVNRYNLDFGSWNGFAYSNTTDIATAGFGNQFSAIAGSGYGPGNDVYGVVSGYQDVLDPLDLRQLESLPYFELPEHAIVHDAYVTNTTYTALSLLNGDVFSKKFGGATGTEEDWYKLIVYGTDESGTLLSNTVEFYLADYRFSDNALDYVVNDWELLDLSSLAGAKRVYFNLASSDVGDWGMNTPGYFAIDNVSYSTVPEPSTWVLMLIGGILLAAYLRL